MLRWAEVKTVIREVISSQLVPMGFPNLGIKMWRVRHEFIDVVHFYMAGSSSRMNIEFGCHPRALTPQQLTPVDCLFRTSLRHTVTTPIRWELYEFGTTLDEQRQKCEIIAPLVVEGVQRWFTHFVTLDTAIEALRQNAEQGLAHVTMANIGSPSYEHIMRVLQALRAERT
jgi:hypothetical protein